MIVMENIRKVYGNSPKEFEALKGVDLKISRGEAVAVLGPSGSGKTTLLEVIGLLSRPTSGRYLVEEKNAGRLADAELAALRGRRMGFVFQTFNLIPYLSVFQNVELPLKYASFSRREKESRIRFVLESVGLRHKASSYAGELSGGEQQRAAVARAIAADPDILLADEPTGNLDSENGAAVIALLMSLWRRGKVLVLITHNETIAGAFPRIIRILDGKITYDGSP